VTLFGANKNMEVISHWQWEGFGFLSFRSDFFNVFTLLSMRYSFCIWILVPAHGEAYFNRAAFCEKWCLPHYRTKLLCRYCVSLSAVSKVGYLTRQCSPASPVIQARGSPCPGAHVTNIQTQRLFFFFLKVFVSLAPSE